MAYSKIKKLYEIYGYKHLKTSECYDVFLIKYGRYSAVDIVIKKIGIEADNIREEYSKLAYAVNLVPFSELNNIEQYLFSGSFNLELTRCRYQEKYKKFVEGQNRQLQFTEQQEDCSNIYEYIDCPYVIEGDFKVDNSQGIIKNIIEIMSTNAPVLILIEAAAGYGKTTTSYELLKDLLNETSDTIPLHTEFSKDRQAKVIKHILQDVVNKEFTAISYELAVHEIKNGRIPLIIDGFDELIAKNNISEIEEINNLTPMLATIADLLENKAKIILTSRSTTLFTSEDFANWINHNVHKFKIVQIRLQKPEPIRWIGYDKYNYLIDNNYHIEMISNPILLNYLKKLELDIIKEKCKNGYDILDDYFERLLNREKVRQDLKLDVAEQLQIFKKLAKQMLSYGIKSDDKDFIKEILYESSAGLLHHTLKKYFNDEYIEIDELLERLSNHALLDKRESNKIGFINDFILGVLCGDNALENEINWLDECFIDDDNVALVNVAYRARNKQKRSSLYSIISKYLEYIEVNTRLLCESDLIMTTKLDYFDELISAIELYDSTIAEESLFKNCIFQGVYFKNVKFNFDNMENISFFSCTFEKCSRIGTLNNISFFQSNDYGSNFISTDDETQNDEEVVYDDYEVRVLQQFCPKGSTRARNKRRMTTLMLGFSSDELPEVRDAIDRLKRKDLIFVKGERAELNLKKAGEIYRMVGKVS